MNTEETRDLLRMRRNLSGNTYDDDTVTAWQMALADIPHDQCVQALLEAAKQGRVMIANVVAHLPQRRPDYHQPELVDEERISLDEYLQRPGHVPIKRGD